MPYNRGSVVLVLFPGSNLKTAKRRPALVVQSHNIGTGLSQTIIAMITSNVSLIFNIVTRFNLVTICNDNYLSFALQVL